MSATPDSPVKPETFALIMATACASLRTVLMAYEDDPDIASKMPKAWARLLGEVAFVHERFGRAVINKE